MDDCLYKYRSVSDNNIESEQSFKSFLSCEAKFSNRNDFNDLFDSKFNIVRPTPKEIKVLVKKAPKLKRLELSGFFNKGMITPGGEKAMELMTKMINDLIDGFYFYCLSGVSNSNLMWSYYANSHKGFCIGFKRNEIDASPVTYKDDIPNIFVSDLMKLHYKIDDRIHLGDYIWKCLRVKLLEWKHENEYRFGASKQMENQVVLKTKNFKIFKYPKEAVASVIFGCRTTQEVKDYIINNYPHDIEYKQAIEKKNSIAVVPYVG